jgi:hypothetical protein
VETSKRFLPTIMKNGWVKDGPPPQFLWEVNGRVYVSGYSKASFQEILSMLRSGTQAKESSAPPVQQLTKAEPSQQKSSPSVSPDPGLAGTSKPSPDVLGIKVGISRIADVRGALGKVTPILSVQERQAQLRGQSSAGRADPEWVTLEDAKYLSQLSGISRMHGTNQGATPMESQT